MPGSARSDPEDEERVRACLQLVGDAALEPAECAVEQRCTVRAVSHRDPVPHRDRWHAAREVLGDLLLIGREQRERARPGLPQQLVDRRLARDRDTDQRRLERQRHEASRP